MTTGPWWSVSWGAARKSTRARRGSKKWLKSVRTAFPGWDVCISPHLTDSEYAATGALARLTESREVKTGSGAICWSAQSDQPRPQAGVSRQMGPDAVFLVQDPALHLATSMRSFRAESLSRFVKALLDGEAQAGRELFESFRDQYPIVLTRSMRAARRWIRRQRRGTERAGLVASSSAQRLKPHAIDIRVNIDPVHWFLSPAKDTRSSLYHTPPIHSFRGAKWTDVKKPERWQYLKNASLVWLTRARQGMVIFVPPGAKRDKTRSPAIADREALSTEHYATAAANAV